jgi:sortase B
MGKVRWVVLILALCVLCYAGFRLFTIYSGYRAADQEYSSLAETFTKNLTTGESAASKVVTPHQAATDTATSVTSQPESETTESRMEFVTEPLAVMTPKPSSSTGTGLIEDAKVPLAVDWEQLRAVNPDVVGWIYVEGIDGINYPILQGENNEYYLKHSFQKQELSSGSIFEDFHNSADFTDPNTIVYGHNMKNGSMFGKLKDFLDQAVYDADPWFWILTPQGNYRYHIFSVFKTKVNSDTYTLYERNGPEFLEWEEQMQEQSAVKNEVPLSESDKTVVLSTCTSDNEYRCVVIGKCVSSDRPVQHQATGLTTVGNQ